ncbi:MAG: hypothetical protein EXR99_15585 [Gemmataceae bacterium]|nr:hypothetical protein [Gemmataceae bacterium]
MNQHLEQIQKLSKLAGEFLALGEQVALAAGVSPATLDGWEGLRKRHAAFLQQGEKPVLVATLYGPTGAGKSTVFRMLTGIEVPAGGSLRPCSMSCAAAVPGSLDDPVRLAALFPDSRCVKLVRPEDIRNSDDPAKLLYATYQAAHVSGIHLVLVDVPDFNAVEKSNWDKAHHMLERAEVVLFLVYPNAYADDRVVEELIRCCRKSARLAYLITMVPPEAGDPREEAGKIWNDLLKKAGGIQGFQQRRSTGESLFDFLRESQAFFSPRSAVPALDQIQPIDPTRPSLLSLLAGLEGEKILLSGLLEPALGAARAVDNFLGTLASRLETLRLRDEATRSEIKQWAQSIAHHEFPAGRLIQITVEEAKRRRGTFLRWISKPFEYLSNGGKKIRDLADWLKGNRGDAPPLKEREALERSRLHEAVLQLPQRWRGAWPDLVGEEGMLSASRCDAALREFEKLSPPAPGVDWESEARKDLETWARENKTKSWFLATVPEVIISASTAVLVVDLFITGGAFTAIALASGVASVGGIGLKFFEENNLMSVARAAQERWKIQRAGELDPYLNSAWADRLLERLRSSRALLEGLPREKLAGLSRQIKEQVKEGGAA